MQATFFHIYQQNLFHQMIWENNIYFHFDFVTPTLFSDIIVCHKCSIWMTTEMVC